MAASLSGKRSRHERIVASPSFEYVYNENRRKHAFLNGARLFNDGFWVSSRFPSLSDVLETIRSDIDIFHAAPKRDQLFAQPLMNFVAHRRGLKTALLPHCVENASHENYYKAPGITFSKGKPLDPEGKELSLAHWAGAIGLPSHDVFSGAWKEFSRAALARVHKRDDSYSHFR
ncbi:MAG TPA: hypothetical protein VIF40_10860 [Methylosinus sp.]|jgi:hypothetical protein|uniref:hypothetical protein n=1 Tax=Methylosinus sp. TaxID=427 RepID=UPI002F955007